MDASLRRWYDIQTDNVPDEEQMQKEKVEASIEMLRHRANNHLALATGYTVLAEICRRLDLTVLSGDVMSEQQWNENLNYLKGDYLPRSKNGSLVLVMRQGPTPRCDGQDVPIAALKLNGNDYFGSTTIGGNHDLSPGELEHLLRQITENGKRTP